MQVKYEIQTRFSYGWENCWKDNGKPVVFDSREQAEKELAEYNADCAAAVKDKDLKDHNPNDYRVAVVGE